MSQKVTVFDLWDRLGVTKHYGGVYATERLVELCGVKPGQRVLEVGCGTGYTACLLAKKYGVDVVALDVNPKILVRAKKRIREKDVGDKVAIIGADAHALPFPAEAFDVVIVESVLAFCDKKKASSEVFRVLKPNGLVGGNEATYLKTPPEELVELLSESVGSEIQLLQADGWRAVYREAGFVEVSSAVYPINFSGDFLSILRVYGVRGYIVAWVRAISDPAIRGLLFGRDISRSVSYFSDVGYGLYVGIKRASSAHNLIKNREN